VTELHALLCKLHSVVSELHAAVLKPHVLRRWPLIETDAAWLWAVVMWRSTASEVALVEGRIAIKASLVLVKGACVRP
jgi:hypothetical protein